MQQYIQHNGLLKGYWNWIALIVLLSSIAVFVYTDIFLVLLAPFAFIFIFWLIVNFKSYYWLFVLAIPFTAVANIGSGYYYLPLMPLSIVSCLLALALILYNRKLIYENFYSHPITLILFLQFFWLVISVVFSEIPFLSFKYLVVNIIQLGAFLLFPMIVLKKKKDWIIIAKILLISFVILSIYVFIRNYLKGFNFSYTNISVKPFFYNHVDHGTVLAMLTPIPYIIWRQVSKEKKWLRMTLILVFIFFLISTYLTFARAAILAVIFSFVILITIKYRLVNLLMVAFFAVSISISTYLIQNDTYKKFRPNFEQTYTRHTFDDLIKATFAGGDMSSAERFYRWIAAVRMSKERPFTGVGPNNFYYYYKPNAVQMFRTYVSRNEEKSTTHNYFLFMLVEQGWPAMILYGIFIWALFNYAQRLYHSKKDIFNKRMVLIAAMVIAAFFINNLFSELLQTYKIGALFYLAVILLFWVENQEKPITKNLSDSNTSKDLP
ncbi:MAG TPA: O-antigen ligase family protein [Edaphocola sp.]|nr:O-antigen ligase family protein [Edaphocola sp.]